jgi:hypothetical protein
VEPVLVEHSVERVFFTWYRTRQNLLKEYLMKILVVGYTTNWKAQVFEALPENCDTVIKGDVLCALEAQEAAVGGFDLYILGNRLCEDNNAGLLILREARTIGDQTPTVIFSEQVNDAALAEIETLNGIWIKSNMPQAGETLASTIEHVLAT